MAAANNDSQGLKIAVAAFVSLTVILAVTSYFLYSSYSHTDARLTAETQKASTADKAARDAISQLDELEKQVGTRANAEFDAVKAEIAAQTKKVNDEIAGLSTQVNDAVTKAEAAGATSTELASAKANVQGLTNSFLGEPNKTFISSLDRLKDLLREQAMLTTALSVNYIDVKRGLEKANGVNQSKLDVASGAANESKTDLEAEHTKHAEARGTLIAKVDEYQTELAKQVTDIANLQNKMRQQEEDYSKRLALTQQTIREIREQLERKEGTLDRPDGYVTYVDHRRGEIHTNLTRSMGFKPQLTMTIFDSQSPGTPTDKPKGTIELVQVGDRDSIARIVKTNNPVDPIRVGDIVYSPVVDPYQAMRIALVGKIDINRDNKDDRADLKRMIEGAGGQVVYDLPPPDVGRKSGDLTGRIDWYVDDDREPLVQNQRREKNLTGHEQEDFLKTRSNAIRELRANGVRPMPLPRLLSELGYDYAAPIRGRAEAVDREALKQLARPRNGTPKNKAAVTPPSPPAARDDASKEETPKEEPR